jgi:uncharacterized protein (TIGR02246 family)
MKNRFSSPLVPRFWPGILAGLLLLPFAICAEDGKTESSSDEDAIRAAVQSYTAAYNRHDAKAVAAHWSETGVWTSPSGEKFTGREAIAKELAAIFDDAEGLRIEVDKPSIRLITSDVAVEEGSVRVFSAAEAPSDSTYVAIHVKKDGHWKLDSVRETELPNLPAASAPLEDLAWLVGDWGDESEEASGQGNVSWTKNKTFLNYSFKVSAPGMDDLEGTQVIGWDPVNETIRSWMFDSDGGFGQGVWSRKDNSWVVKFSQVLADGRTASATNIYTPIDANHFTWKSVGREVDGQYLPNIAEIKIARAGAAEASAEPGPEKSGKKSKPEKTADATEKSPSDKTADAAEKPKKKSKKGI